MASAPPAKRQKLSEDEAKEESEDDDSPPVEEALPLEPYHFPTQPLKGELIQPPPAEQAQPAPRNASEASAPAAALLINQFGRPPPSSTKPKEIARFGNYLGYYGYRTRGDSTKEGKHGGDTDKRVQLWKPEWFANKRVLDIGCNSGLVTMDIARSFSIRSILGADIDSRLIELAKKSLSKYQRQILRPQAQNSPSSKSIGHLVRFATLNYVEDELTPTQCGVYEVITCLSVVKWIHLNWGDEGIVKLFRKVFLQLTIGGLFIMEPQAFRTYRHKAKRLSKELQKIYDTIRIFPGQFVALLKAIGFEQVETQYPEDSNKGFQRPVHIFKKTRTDLSPIIQNVENAMKALEGVPKEDAEEAKAPTGPPAATNESTAQQEPKDTHEAPNAEKGQPT